MRLSEVAKWVGGMPGWQLILWFSWLVLGLLLLVVTLKFRQETVDTTQAERLSSIEKQLEALTRAIHSSVAVPIVLPEPVPQRHVGWRVAVAETAGTDAASGADSRKVEQLFEVVTAQTALVNVILNGGADVNTLILSRSQAKHPPPTAAYEVKLSVKNVSASPVILNVPKGQVFENSKPNSGLQNLVAARDVSIPLAPGEERTLAVPAFCLNHHLGPPRGEEGNITPLKLKFEFNDQGSVWAGVERVMGPSPRRTPK